MPLNSCHFPYTTALFESRAKLRLLLRAYLLAGLLRGASVTGKPMPRKTSPRHLQNRILSTSTREAITAAFAKTTTLPQAPAEPSPQHLPRQKLDHKQPSPWHLPRQQPYHKHPRSLHHGICQDETLATSRSSTTQRATRWELHRARRGYTARDTIQRPEEASDASWRIALH